MKYLFIVLFGLSSLSSIKAETSFKSEMTVVLEANKNGVKKKLRKKIKKIKTLFLKKNDSSINAMIFLVGLVSLILFLVGIFAVQFNLIFLGSLAGIIGLISGIVQINNGNNHWAIITGMLLGGGIILASLISVLAYLGSIDD